MQRPGACALLCGGMRAEGSLSSLTVGAGRSACSVLLQLNSRSLLCLKQYSLPLLPALFEAVTSVFGARPYAHCLQATREPHPTTKQTTKPTHQQTGHCPLWDSTAAAPTVSCRPYQAALRAGASTCTQQQQAALRECGVRVQITGCVAVSTRQRVATQSSAATQCNLCEQ